MPDDPTPTTLRRQLGARLRQLRQERGLTAQQVADALGFSISKVSRMESGARAVSDPDIVALSRFFDLDPVDTERVKALAISARRRATLGAPPPTRETIFVKIEQNDFVELERDAVRVREFNSGHVPGLLQTERYMRASMAGTAPDVSASVISRAVEVRRSRQRKFDVGFSYEVIVDQAALSRAVGGRDVMAEQAARILSLEELGLVRFAVIPFSAGAHPGANSQFITLSLPQTDIPDVVFAEGLFGHAKFSGPADIRRFEEIWEVLESHVEPAEETRRRLRVIAAAGDSAERP